METVTDFLFLDSKIIADTDFIHEIKTTKTLVPWKESYDRLLQLLLLSPFSRVRLCATP